MSDPIGFYARTERAENLSGKDFPKKSKLALQMESKGGILTKQIASRSTFSQVPILGKISIAFAERSVKREYLQNYRETFIKNASENGLSIEEANDLFDRHVMPVLADTDLKNIAGLETFTNQKAGLLLFVSAYKSVRPDLRVQEIRQNILRSTRTLQTESASVERLFSLYLNTEEIFEELTHDTTYHLLDTGLRDVEETPESKKKKS